VIRARREVNYGRDAAFMLFQRKAA
jgi:hypothetical protein